MEEGKIIGAILKKPLEEGQLRQTLEDMALEPTYENGILLQLVRKAAGGDLTAAKYILDATRQEKKPGEEDLRQMSTQQLQLLLGR